MIAEFSRYPPVAPANLYSQINARIVSQIGMAITLDSAHHTTIHFSHFWIGLISSRINSNTRPVLTKIIGDLMNKRWYLVDRQAWPIIRLALRLYISRPLIANKELQVLKRLSAVVCLCAD